MLKILLDYPNPADEAQIVARSLVAAAAAARDPRRRRACSGSSRPSPRSTSTRASSATRSALVEATRKLTYWGAPDLESYVSYGASPRGSINLIHGARAMALLHGRRYVLPSDVIALAPDVLRHRLVLSYAALADGITADTIVERVLTLVPAPRLEMAVEPTA